MLARRLEPEISETQLISRQNILDAKFKVVSLERKTGCLGFVQKIIVGTPEMAKPGTIDYGSSRETDRLLCILLCYSNILVVVHLVCSSYDFRQPHGVPSCRASYCRRHATPRPTESHTHLG